MTCPECGGHQEAVVRVAVTKTLEEQEKDTQEQHSVLRCVDCGYEENGNGEAQEDQVDYDPAR